MQVYWVQSDASHKPTALGSCGFMWARLMWAVHSCSALDKDALLLSVHVCPKAA